MTASSSMFIKKSLVFFASGAALMALALPAFAGPEGKDAGLAVTVEKLDGKFQVKIAGELFAEYVCEGFAKPIIYPIIGPYGISMTRNYPMKEGVPGESQDHPHQKSLWFTHGDVNGVDFWAEGENCGKIVQDEVLEVSAALNRGTIKTHDKWVGPDGKVSCTDTRTTSFEARPEGRIIDIEIAIHASEGDVTFGDTKEGTMGIRSHPALNLKPDPKVGSNGKAVNSEGVQGPIAIWGKKAKWVDYWGTIDGHVVGFAIFDHPKNPRHPTWWHAREYGLVAANPFGIHDFEKQPDGTGDMLIKAGESVTFAYRFLFHEGDAVQAKIAEAYAAYAGE